MQKCKKDGLQFSTTGKLLAHQQEILIKLSHVLLGNQILIFLNNVQMIREILSH